MLDCYSDGHVKRTRKRHQCCYCGSWVEPGSTAYFESGIDEDGPFRRYVCASCEPLVGEFWSWLHDETGEWETTDLMESFGDFLEAKALGGAR